MEGEVETNESMRKGFSTFYLPQPPTPLGKTGTQATPCSELTVFF